EDGVHCQKRRGHAARGLQEVPAAHAQATTNQLTGLINQPLNPHLRRCLGWRDELPVRDDLRRNRRREGDSSLHSRHFCAIAMSHSTNLAVQHAAKLILKTIAEVCQAAPVTSTPT